LKTRVYALSRYANREREVIPRATIEKPPSAELRPASATPTRCRRTRYSIQSLEAYVERYASAEQIVDERKAAGHPVDLALVRRVLQLVERSEYKRQQQRPSSK